MKQSIFTGFALMTLMLFCELTLCIEPATAKSPVKTLQVTITEGQQEYLKDEIIKFAQTENFDVKTAQVHPDKRFYIVHLERSDFEIIVLNPRKTDVFEFSFYFSENVDEQSQSKMLSLLQNLINHLKLEPGFKVEIMK